jgi:hypothetical protein
LPCPLVDGPADRTAVITLRLMPPREPFPFPPLTDGDLSPGSGPGDIQELLQRDVQIVRWFIEKAGWTDRGIPPASALGEFLAASEAINLHGPSKTVEEVERENARHLLHFSASLVRLAWAIRALHGFPGLIDRVDASFIGAELLGSDTKEPGVEKVLPAGVGTIVFAGRLLQAGGGRVVSINGHHGVGHDIKWVSGAGDTFYIERKDRSYEAGLADTPEKRIGRVVAETRKAGLSMPQDLGAVRVLVVGFQHLVRRSEISLLHRGYEQALQREFGKGRVRSANLPHVVIVEHLGMEPKTGGEKLDSFSPHVLQVNPKKLMGRAVTVLWKAIGGRG